MGIKVGDIVRVKDDCGWSPRFMGRIYKVGSCSHNRFTISLTPHNWRIEDRREIMGTKNKILIEETDLKDVVRLDTEFTKKWVEKWTPTFYYKTYKYEENI